MSPKEYRSILHLEINGCHEYYGSPSSLYDKHTPDELGITQASLNNYFSKLPKTAELVYTNKFCVIRKGALYVKPSTRGRKKSE